MNCRECQDILDNLLVAEPTAAERAALAEHLEECPECARQAADARRALADITPTIEYSVSAALRDRILAAVSDAQMSQPTPKRLHIWSIIMQNRWTKSAAAAVVLVVAGITVRLFDRAATTSYAFEQTIEASRAARSVHVQNISPPAIEPQDTWLEYDAQGDVRRLRIEEGKDKTFRIMVWAEGRLRWFSPAKNEFMVKNSPDIGAKMRDLAGAWDPKAALESIRELEKQGVVTIRLQEPKAADEPITLEAERTGRMDQTKRSPADRCVLLIDPKTKLVTQRDTYALVGGAYQLQERRRYLDYDAPIDPAKFVLDRPKGVRVDDRTQGIGLAQDKMTDAEAAAAVVRKYIEALVAKDYATAGRLYNGKPAEELRQWVEGRLKVRYLRVVHIGDPKPARDSGPRVFDVPFTLELEKDGVKEISGPPVKSGPGPRTHRAARVHPVADQPDRWVITGGI